jgi:hypothetical protein
MGEERISGAYELRRILRRILQRMDILNKTYNIQILVGLEDKGEN